MHIFREERDIREMAAGSLFPSACSGKWLTSAQSLVAAKTGRSDADKKHNQNKKEDFRVSSRDDMCAYMPKLSASLLDKPKTE